MEREHGIDRNPDGPLTPETYRKRRRGVLVALLVTVGLAAWVLSSGGGEDTTSAQRPSPGKQPAAAQTPGSGSGEGSPKHAATVTVSATPTATVTVTAAPTYPDTSCRKHPVRLVVRTAKNAYGEGEEPRLAVRVTPGGRCALDPDKLELVVKSGTERIWSSQDCAGRDRWPQRIAPQHPYRTTVTWERDHSNPATCGEQPQPVGPGWYTVVATLGQHESGETAFRLVSG